MNWMVSALGLALAMAGGLSMYSGNDIIQVERGWAWVIAGAALTAGGFVTFAIGLMMFRLEELRHNLVAALVPKQAVDITGLELIKTDGAARDDRAGDAPVAVVPEARHERADDKVAPLTAAAISLGDDWLDTTMSSRTSPPPAVADIKREAAAPVLNGASKTVAALDESAPAERTILGRYTASNISYAMYSDGSIDADDGIRLRHFNSMQELKAHISSSA